MNYKIEWNKIVNNSIDSYRTEAEKDYDKIVFSQAFRRLANKTQVHPLAKNDHVHNRMSHSIEVSSLCRSIVSKITVDGIIPEDFKLSSINTVMAAGLGHDMGNPPFGHIGESSIRKWIDLNYDDLRSLDIDPETISSYKSFDGNAQNFHIFNNYEYFKTKSISSPTIAAMVKYPVVAKEKVEKSGYFSIEKDKFESCFKSLGLFIDGKFVRHPLSFILEAADDICYAIMDIDDAIEMDYLETKGGEFVKIMKHLFGYSSKSTNYKDYRSKRGEIIDKAVSEISDVFGLKYEIIMNGNVPFRTDLIKYAENKKTLTAIRDLKRLASTDVFKHRRKVQFEAASYAILHRIFDNWLIAYKDFAKYKWEIDKCDDRTKKIFQMLDIYEPSLGVLPSGKDEGLTRIIDFVSGCTDRYANKISQAFLGVIK